MKLTVLGNQGPYPQAGGACSSYLVEQGEQVFLLDCGSGAVEALQRLGKLPRVQAVVLSHLHFDHFSDLLMLQYALAGQGLPMPLPVYAPAQPASVFSLLCQQPTLQVTPLAPGQAFSLGDLDLDTCAGIHPVPSLAYRWQAAEGAFVYSGDTNEAPALADFARGAAVLLCDAGVMETAWTSQSPHLSPLRAARLAQQAGVRRLLITHFGPGQDPDAAVLEARQVFSETYATKRLAIYDANGACTSA